MSSVASARNLVGGETLDWGIQGYKAPTEFRRQPKYTVSKQKVNFIDAIITKGKKGPPGPGEYKITKKWEKSILGYMKGGKKNTFLDTI
jgi:hypothetical protein